MRMTDEQRAFTEVIRDFCRRECGTREQRDALTHDGAEEHNQALYQQMADLGWAGVSIPEEYGGSGGGLFDQCLFFEETHRGLAPIAGAGGAQMVAGPYKKFGTEEQKQDMLPKVAGGAVLSISISEPEAGSDVSGLKCRAEKVDGGYVINGQKTWCSYAHFADYILLVARTSKEDSPHAGMTMFEIATDLEGIEVRGIPTMVGRDVNDVFFTDCFVPDDKVIGEVGGAWKQVMAGLNGERLIISAESLGRAERALDDLLAYVKERRQFGKPIGTFQALRHRIADLAADIEACRYLTYEVADRIDTGRGDAKELTRLTSMAKLKATETAKQVTLEGLQMMGGYGYATEYDMERHVRHALSPPIYGGTNEIQREIISGTYGLR
jgi:butyryl-CoA dehydrogenase